MNFPQKNFWAGSEMDNVYNLISEISLILVFIIKLNASYHKNA